MKKLAMLAVAAIALVFGACEDSVENPGCDLFTCSATVTGVAYDFEGEPLAGADVEFTMADTSRCDADFRGIVGRGQTGMDGGYEVTLRAGNTVGTRCVFGRVVGSDATTSGRVRFTSDCQRTEPVYEIELDLVLPAVSVLPADFSLTLYRLHSFNMGPHYTVGVKASGRILFEPIDNCLVSEPTEATIDLVSLVRLYNAFEDIGYWHIKTLYDREECEQYSTDVHYCSMRLKANGRSHDVIHDHGCRGIAVLDSLTELECDVDSVLGTIQWTGIDAWPCR